MRPFKILPCLLIIIAFTVASGCKPKYRKQEQPAAASLPDQESIYQSNQSVIRKNAQTIRDLAIAKGWDLTESGTGVFYHVFAGPVSNQLKPIEPGDRVSLDYQLSLVDGTKCYSSKTLGFKQFVVEKSDAEQGLHEAVQYLHPGDSALVIIPPHRAFGLSGDGNLIPPGAILIYEIRVDSVFRHQKD